MNRLSHALMFMLVTLFASCQQSQQAAEKDTYTCPMHPTVVSDKPSTCPVCGMDLVRKAKPGEEVQMTDELARLTKSPNETIVASIRTVKGEFRSMTVERQVSGVVTYDERKVFAVPSRLAGRLEKVNVRYSFQPVRRGQVIAEIYSPDMASAQRELLYLTEGENKDETLVNAAKSKLSLLGATSKEIERLLSTREVNYVFPIFANEDGYAIAVSAVAPRATPATNSAATPQDAMSMSAAQAPSNSNTATATTTNAAWPRAGTYVTQGETIFRIVNAHSLWIEFRLPAGEMPSVKTGSALAWSAGGKTQTSRVDFIEPFGDENDFVTVRSYITTGQLAVGQLVVATLRFTSTESMWLPKEALVDLGDKQVVFIKKRGQFKAVAIERGLETSGKVQVLRGLTSGDEVAANGQYLVDSESFIKDQP